MLDGKLYAAGGKRDNEEEDDEQVPISTVERYDPARNAWEEVASMGTARVSPGVALL